MLPARHRARSATSVVVYASDYCHWDCTFPDTVKIIAERNDVSDTSKKRIFDENAARLYPLVGRMPKKSACR